MLRSNDTAARPRLSRMLWWLAGLLVILPALAQTTASPFNIPAQPLSSALLQFSDQSGVSVAVAHDLTAGLTSKPVVGTFSASDALARLLDGSPLRFEFVDPTTVRIQQGRPDTRGGPGKTENSSSAGAPRPQADAPDATMGEVVVTAQKREERLKDVPAPVTVLNTTQLTETNQVRLSDYFDKVPGFYATPDQFGRSNLSIRGISPVGDVPTVGIVIDDVPFGLSSGSQTGFVPDIDPGELERIEVLRGPQGTLYGADAMGGLVKYVTRDPSVEAFSARLDTGASDVSHGSDPGYNLRASANIPISPEFAVRVGGFTRQDPGYIDNPLLQQDGINQTQSYGSHLSALWKPSDTVSLKLSALYQDSRLHGLAEADVPTPGYPQTTGLGPLQQNYLAGTGKDEIAIQDYSATLKADLGRIKLTSITGYNVTHVPWSVDLGFLISPSQVSESFPGTTGVPYFETDHEIKFSQEIRLATSIATLLDIELGGFYTHENSNGHFIVYGENATYQRLGVYWTFDQPKSELNEYAVFIDVTAHLTDHFDLQLGGRQSFFTTDLGQTVQAGPYAAAFLGGNPSIGAELSGSKHPFTYLVTPRYKVSPDLMLYARLASGYRLGQPNAAIPNVPRESSPDQTRDYELGVKADLLDRLLSVDASIYYVDWRDIQLSLRDPATHFVYFGNAGGAKSQGLEFSLESRPLTATTLDATFSYDDATLSKGFPAGSQYYGVPGNRLPFTSRYSGTLSAEQQFPIAGVTGFIGAVAAYIGDRQGEFVGTAERQDLPAYTKLDLHAGFRQSGWTVTAYANNVTDKRALLNGGLGYFYTPARLYITPRTIGVDISKVL